MKIVFFIGSMQRGGAERVISILANEYCKCGWSVDIALLLNTSVAYDLDERINVVDLTAGEGGYVKNAALWVGQIRKFLKGSRPDRVVSFVGRINALVLTAAIGLRLPIIVSERNDPKHDGRGRAMQMYCNFIYKGAKAIVYQNQYEKSCFSRALNRIGHVIPNPVSVSTVHDGKEFGRTIATAGRLMDQKNHAMLIDAVSVVSKEYPDIKCEIYGEGVLRDDLQNRIESHGLTGKVSLQGNVSNIHERLKECGIFVMTSEFEGLSNALVEAMMMGLPCITTDYPGVDELIRDGENGIIVPRRDVDGLVRAISRLICDEDGIRGRIATQAQKDAEQFSADRVLKKWHQVIDGKESNQCQ
ncbi:MAG: glycosyltransferase family 4 protein [Ruminococcaceae bacterium]|nr:glycosyltransferase family 4 protein [Oscillospiraceae bacterium]